MNVSGVPSAGLTKMMSLGSSRRGVSTDSSFIGRQKGRVEPTASRSGLLTLSPSNANRSDTSEAC
jgi:hypothetical protein